MKIAIVGCGKVGTEIARQLSAEGHDITVVDTDPERIRRTTDSFDVIGIVGNGSSKDVLSELNLSSSDVFISVTGSDELNLISCMFAKKASGCYTIARVRNPVYSRETEYICRQMDISTIINQDFAAASEISRLLRYPAATKIDTFAGGLVRLVKIILPDNSALLNVPVKDLPAEICGDVLFCAVERGGEVLIPRGDFCFASGDSVTFITSRDNLPIFLKKIGMPSKPAKKAILVGGSTIAYYLVDNLLSYGIEPTVIEKDAAKCVSFSDSFPKAVVLNADGTDREFLLSEGIAKTDAFVSLTNVDEENVLLSLFAKKHSKAKVVTKINRLELDDVTDELNLGSVIYPKFMTCDTIVKTVRALCSGAGSNLKTLYRILDDRLEALEFFVKEASEVTDTPLSHLKVKKSSLICCITRGGKVIIPRGADCILPGDSVIVVSKEPLMGEITDILQK